MRSIHIAIMLGLGLAGCGGANVETHAESIPAHQADARHEDSEARQHAALYDPNARLVETCQNVPGPAPAEPCFTSVVNPTDQERVAANQHRRAAAEHRAASRELRDAETRACVGVPESQRDLCPLMHTEDIVAVTPIEAPGAHGELGHTLGAQITFRAVRGLDLEWLQRVLACHAAQADAFGEGYENPSCPLVLRGVTVEVAAAGEGFLISLRADDPVEGQTVYDRARELVRDQLAKPYDPVAGSVILET